MSMSADKERTDALDAAASIAAISLFTPATAVSKQLTGRGGILTGFSFRETTGAAAASVRLIDGQDGTGPILATFSLPAGGSVTVATGVYGLIFSGGLYLSVLTGSLEGSAWVLPALQS